MKIIFIGTSKFAANILQRMIYTEYRPCLVITSSDKPSGRGKKIKAMPVSLIAENKGILIKKTDNILELNQEIKKENPVLIIVCAYGKKIPKEILEIPEKGCLNIHPSLLPKYRGPSPISQSIINNDQKTGVTIMLMNDRIDQGKIIKQVEYKIKKGISFLELSQELAEKGADLIIETIPQWINNKLVAQKQQDSQATYTKMIKKEDGKINWSQSAQEIDRQVKALNPQPGTFSFFKDKKSGQKKIIKILETDVQEQTEHGPFGDLGKVYVATNNNLAVQTGKDFLIIKKLQMENKNPVSAGDFMNGNIDFIGTILE